MFERFTDQARRIVVLAQEEARLLDHDYIGTEHILLGLIHEDDGIAARVLMSLGISLAEMRVQVEARVGRGTKAISGHIPFTPRAKKVLELSLNEALELGHNYIGTEHILLGVIREGEGVAAQVLAGFGADLVGLRQRVIQTLSADAGRASMPTTVSVSEGSSVGRQFVGGRADPLEPRCSFCGRDLWDVDHYAGGPAVFMCDACIVAARLALDAAAEAPQLLVLPPRVFGAPPDDEADSTAAIVLALRAVFGALLDDRTQTFVEDGAQIVPILRATQERTDARVTDVLVVRVRYSSPSNAAVGFELKLDNGARVSFIGAVTRVGDRWIVTRSTVADVLRLAGVALPPSE